MSKQALTEFVNEDIKLLENEETESGLPKFKGIFQKCDEKNRNGRIYSSKLWENVIKSDGVQKKLKKRTMLGELNHPEYRDPNPENASHVVTKLWLSEDNKYVYGEAEILDTPKGRILESLLRAGVEIGVSSRGEGQMVERGGDSYVDEDSYDLITFDGVLEPSVEEAEPSLVESKFGLAMTNMLTEGTLGEKEVAIFESLSEQFSDQEIANSLKAQILEAKSKITTKEHTRNSMSQDQKTLDRLYEANEKLSDAKEELVRIKEKNKTLRNKIAEHKSKIVGLKKGVSKLSEIAKAVPNLKSELKEEKAKTEKAIAVIEGLKDAFDSERSSKDEVTRHYEKALKVLEGVQEKLNSSKVEDYLEESLEDVGGVDRFRKIIGDTKNLSLDEAKEKVDEILNLLDEGSFSPISSTRLKLRENEDDSKGKSRKKRKSIDEKSKSERQSTENILNQM